METGFSQTQSTVSKLEGPLPARAEYNRPVLRFLELLAIWADLDLDRPLSAAGIQPHVDAVNNLLRLPEGNPASFIHTMNGVPVTPVPFILQGNARKVGVAILGLNPKAAGKATLEELAVIKDLVPEAYARFYTSERCLPHALKSPYYRNLATVLLSIERGKLFTFSDYRKNYREILPAFAGILSQRGVLEMRLIPFYSVSWRPWGPGGLTRLLDHPRYGPYYDNLTNLVEEFLEPDGWLIANGRDPAALLPRLLAARAPLTWLGPDDPTLPYSFHRWQKWRIVCLKHFLRSKGGKLNSNQDLARLFTDISLVFGP